MDGGERYENIATIFWLFVKTIIMQSWAHYLSVWPSSREKRIQIDRTKLISIITHSKSYTLYIYYFNLIRLPANVISSKRRRHNAGWRQSPAKSFRQTRTTKHLCAMESSCASWWIVCRRESFPGLTSAVETTRWWTTSASTYWIIDYDLNG